MLAQLLAVTSVGPAPELFERDFHVVRPDGEPIEVTEARPLPVPYPFADFDLFADVEVPDGGAMDIVLRKVEPRRRAGGDMALFHGRFVALRLSANGREGPAFRTREQALFDDGFDGGQEVAPGLPATVLIEGRGRLLRANVAGVWHGPFESTDAHGAISFVVRGGIGLVRSLRIDRVPRPVRLLPITWCAIGGALLGLLAGVRGRKEPLPATLGALLAVPAAAWLAGRLLMAHVLPETEPSTTAVVLAALSGGPLAVALAGRRRLLWAGLGLAAVLLAWEGAARAERLRLGALEDPRLDAYFGAQSGTAPFDALARRLQARTAVHTVEASGLRVMCLGGGPLFEGAPDPEEWVGPMLAAHVGRAVGEPVDAAVVPTLYSHVRQQLALFERFYAEPFAPRAVVLALPPWEGEASERPDAVAVLDGDWTPEAPGPSVLLTLWARAAEPRVPGSDPERLTAALDAFAERARAGGWAVVLVDDPAAPGRFREVFRLAARAHGWQHETLALLTDPGGSIPPLAAAIVAALQR